MEESEKKTEYLKVLKNKKSKADKKNEAALFLLQHDPESEDIHAIIDNVDDTALVNEAWNWFHNDMSGNTTDDLKFIISNSTDINMVTVAKEVLDTRVSLMSL